MPWSEKIEVAIISQILFPENPFNPQGIFFINEFFDSLAIFVEYLSPEKVVRYKPSKQ